MARRARDPEGLSEGWRAPRRPGCSACSGLLIAFTFSGAASRFEDRRHLISDGGQRDWHGLPSPRSACLAMRSRRCRELFRRYVDVRATVYRNALGSRTSDARSSRTGAALQGEIWAQAWTACRQAGGAAAGGHAPAPGVERDDRHHDHAGRRRPESSAAGRLPVARRAVPGWRLAGRLRQRRQTAAAAGFTRSIFAAILSLTVYVIIDIEFPRLGLIRVDASDQVLIDLRKSMQ